MITTCAHHERLASISDANVLLKIGSACKGASVRATGGSGAKRQDCSPGALEPWSGRKGHHICKQAYVAAGSTVVDDPS